MIEYKCNCEMKIHKAPLEKYIISEGAINNLSDLLKDYQLIYLVCDENTYNVLGKKDFEILQKNNKEVNIYILKGDVLPNAQSIGEVLIHLYNPQAESNIFEYSPKPDFILGVGSGVINDICRLVSYRVGLPYGIAGTAPSMDGYASAGSPILFDGTKATIKCTTPKYIIADLDVMKEAPLNMLLSGIGDMFGKYTGLLDWQLAHNYNGDYFCEKIACDVLEATNKCLEEGYTIKERNPQCIASIMQGFMTTGLGMAFVGNSRPASGSEHIIAHAWELESVEKGEKPNLHGLEVVEASLIVFEMYRLLYQETNDENLKSLIEKYLPYFDKVDSFCKEMNMPIVTKDYDRIIQGIYRALGLRNRYTILLYLRDKGMLERYAEYASKNFLQKYLTLI